MKVQVVAHQGHLVIIPDNPLEGINDRWWPTGGSKLGCVLGDTKIRLGVSEEALALMRRVQVGRDAIGDLSWWACDDGTYAFAWWGPLFRLVDPSTAVAARDFREYADQCLVIPNVLGEEYVADVEAAIKAESGVWREPFRVEPDPYQDE